jgi:hypothetical protein
MRADPIVALRKAGEKLRPDLREQVLALGPEAVATLVEVLNEGLGDWPSIHAVDLLADLKATEAIQPMLEALGELDLNDILHSRIVLRLPDLGRGVAEPALVRLTRERERGEDADAGLIGGLCEILSKLGVRDERIFDALCFEFEQDEAWGAGALAAYGDPRALPLIEDAIEGCEPDFGTLWGQVEVADLLDAHKVLGGVLRPELQNRVDGWLARFEEGRRRAAAKRAAAKLGRNDPCHCGSRKKYKKCCLDADEAARPKLLERNGDRLGGSSAGRGPAQQMVDYVQPIIDATDGDREGLQRALDIGMFFWNLAITPDAAEREDALREMLEGIGEAERAMFKETAKMMIERHRKMFPEMHIRT